MEKNSDEKPPKKILTLLMGCFSLILMVTIAFYFTIGKGGDSSPFDDSDIRYTPLALDGEKNGYHNLENTFSLIRYPSEYETSKLCNTTVR